MQQIHVHTSPKHTIAQSQQVVKNIHGIQQLVTFAQRCERLKLHALAAHAFRQIIQLAPEQRCQYVGHYLYNAREARRSGCLRGFAASNN